MKKTKVLVIADSPLVPSGVGVQTRYMVESLLGTGEYTFFCLAGAVRHNDYRMQKTDEWGDDLIIKPVDGYGTPEIVRAVLRDFRPDVVWFMTDPRFFTWLWEIEHEIRPHAPMVYYHVWDNYPYPDYNKKFYDSNDVICTISKLTDDIVRTVSPSTKAIRIPHTVDTDIFKKADHESVQGFRSLIEGDRQKTIFFWNNRNARRKLSGSLIYWFKDFLEIVGEDNACLLMHTHPGDPHGQDLRAIVNSLGLKENKQVLFSIEKLSPTELGKLYSSVDCTINISDAEGFGLATLESLACETPIIVNMTGGLQEQVTDGTNWFGFGIEPSSKAIIGSQEVPYIYEDRINKKDFVNALVSFYNLSKDEREQLGRNGRKHVLQNYSLEQYSALWKETFDYCRDSLGSWKTRKNYQGWSFGEIK